MATVAEGRLAEESFSNQTARMEHESNSDFRRSQNLQRGLAAVVNLVNTGLKVLSPLI